MTRRVLAALLVGTLALVTLAAADDTKPAPKKDDASSRDEAVLQQQRLSNQFRDFEQKLLNLAQRLERSSKPEDQSRAKTLKDAIRAASDKNVNTNFEKLINLLKGSKGIDLAEIKEAAESAQLLAEDIRHILSLLLSDNRDEQIKSEKERIKRLLVMIDKVTREQKVERAKTELGRTERDKLVQGQKKVTESAKEIDKAMEKKDAKGDGKNKDGKEGEKKNGKEGKEGEKKDGKEGEKKDGKDGEKGEGKPGEPKDGEKKDGQKGSPKGGTPKDGKQGDGKPNDGQKKDGDKPQPDDQAQAQPMPGKKQIQDAIEEMKKAEKRLAEEKRRDASRNQDEAIRNLEKARKQLEELLRQLREEEQERLLVDLQRRCERMLQMQVAVMEDTVRLDRAIQQNSDRKPDRTQEQDSLKLSDREQDIVREADRALQLLATEGSAVAFAEVFTQVRDDMRAVSRRLGKVDVGHVTQATEQDIISMLKEMIEALKRQQQKLQEQKNQPPPPQGGEPPPQSLIDILQELRMIRSMQIQVNNRTLVYGKQYPGEQAADPDIVKELVDLARRQQKIFQVTNDIARGKNK
jgi:hypothetical protein